MIYSKKANFPYPLLTNDSNEYKDAAFEFDAFLSENNKYYIFEIQYKISSHFIKKLLYNNQAKLILIIKSKDNQFHELNYNQDIIEIKKSRLFIGSKTVLQLMIKTTETISFSSNYDLNEFYDEQKDNIIIDQGMGLAFSNQVIFDGGDNKPFELFEKKVDKNIKSDIEIVLSNETIVIVYKNEEFMPIKKELNYPYIYLGLQKALIRFISHYSSDLDEIIDIPSTEPNENSLDNKLLRLMQSKRINELSLAKIDEVIYLMTDDIIKKYNSTIRSNI